MTSPSAKTNWSIKAYENAPRVYSINAEASFQAEPFKIMRRLLHVKKKDLEEYRIFSNKDNKIRLFWTEIINEMPYALRKEVKTKPTNLAPENKSRSNILIFKTTGPSLKLEIFLSQFKVILNIKNTNHDSTNPGK